MFFFAVYEFVEKFISDRFLLPSSKFIEISSILGAYSWILNSQVEENIFLEEESHMTFLWKYNYSPKN